MASCIVRSDSTVNMDGSSAESYLSVESDGRLMMYVRHTAINSKTLMGSIVYFTE